MAVAFRNYEYSFLKNGKHIFCQTENAKTKAKKLKNLIERSYTMPEFYFHYQPNGHIAALHRHRHQKYFAKLDIQNYFYSISRNRVERAFVRAGISRAHDAARWSCVKNPYVEPRYVVPYGFVQSSAIASLVMFQSGIHTALEKIREKNIVSVYVDDISISGNNLNEIGEAFEMLCNAIIAEKFFLNQKKLIFPNEQINVFNCDLEHGSSKVSYARQQKFFQTNQTSFAEDAFKRYCDQVSEGNIK